MLTVWFKVGKSSECLSEGDVLSSVGMVHLLWINDSVAAGGWFLIVVEMMRLVLIVTGGGQVWIIGRQDLRQGVVGPVSSVERSVLQHCLLMMTGER